MNSHFSRRWFLKSSATGLAFSSLGQLGWVRELQAAELIPQKTAVNTSLPSSLKVYTKPFPQHAELLLKRKHPAKYIFFQLSWLIISQAKHLKMINESKILELIKRQKETGLNITAFCANEGIPKSSFYYWRKKLSKEPGKRFIPLLVNSTPAPMGGHSKDYIQEQHEHHISGDDFLLELHYPNGTRLRIKSDPDFNHLRTLVCLLD